MNRSLPSGPRPIWAPLAQLLGALGGVLLFVVSLFLGLVVVAVVAGFAVLVILAVSIRMWWLRRRRQRTGRGADPGDVTTIEGEYIVLEERRRRR